MRSSKFQLQTNRNQYQCWLPGQLSLFTAMADSVRGTGISPVDWELDVDEDVDLSDLDDDLRKEMETLLAQRLLEALPKATVTIKFTLNSGERLTSAYNLTADFKSIKASLSSKFNVPADTLMIFRGDRELSDDSSPCDLGVQPFSCIELRLQTKDPFWTLRGGQLALPTPDILTVSLDDDHAVVVEVENRAIRKPYLGGYRDPDTGLEYLNAETQTGPPVKKFQPGFRLSRDTQTAATVSEATATTCEAATQSGEHHFIYQKVIVPGTYKPATGNREQAVRVIQRYLRATRMRKKLKELSAEYQKRRKAEEIETARQDQLIEVHTGKDVKRMACPRTKEDFDVLYAMVDRWRRAQTERIANLKTEAPKKAELCTVLEKEVKLLESIEAHRIRAREQQEKEKARRTLLNAGQPVSWTGYRGLKVSMDTLRTQRARELAGLYDALGEEAPPAIRVERLVALKYALAATNTPTAAELSELVDREAELLARGAKGRQLQFLRARIQQLFVRFFKEVDSKQEEREKCQLFCRQCRRMRSKAAFSVSARDREAAVCTPCRATYGEARTAQDYRHILRAVRRDEQHRGCYSSCAYVMSEEDMAFLVANIWHGRSAISAADDLRALRLLRWDLSQDWAPWNCVLLTAGEARLHERTGHGNYGEHLVREVAAKHTLARSHFAQLQDVDDRLRDTGVWVSVVDTQPK